MKFWTSSSLAEDSPAILAIFILLASLFLFGADAPASSLLITALTLSVTIFGVLSYDEMKPRLWTLPFVISWAVLIAIHYYTELVADGEHEYLMLLSGACFFWIGRYVAQSRRRRSRFFNYLTGFALLFAAASFFQHVIAPDFVIGHAKKYHFDRLTGPFLSSNTTATFSGVLLVFIGFRILRKLQNGGDDTAVSGFAAFAHFVGKYPLSLPAFLFLTTCVMLTGSRAGFFATSLSLVILLLSFIVPSGRKSEDRRTDSGKLLKTIFPAIALTLVAIWSLSGTLVETRLERLDQDYEARQIMFDASWRAGELRPWTGHGLDGLQYAKQLVVTPETNRSVDAQNASHNLFAQWFVQAGWPGLSGLILIVFFVLWRTVTSQEDNLIKGWQIATITLTVSHGLFDYALEIPSVFLLVSLLVGLGQSKSTLKSTRN